MSVSHTSFWKVLQAGHHQPTGIILSFPSGPFGLMYALTIATRTFSALQTGQFILRHITGYFPRDLVKGLRSNHENH
jgi:hypothetical protein